MSASVALLGAMAVLYACGVYLLLEKSVTRIILGILLIGTRRTCCCSRSRVPRARPDIAGSGPSSDPLPQALILTAIVITFAVSAFLWRSSTGPGGLAQEDRLERDEADVAVGQGDQPETEAAAADEESEFDRPGGTDDRPRAPRRDPAILGAPSRCSPPRARACSGRSRP